MSELSRFLATKGPLLKGRAALPHPDEKSDDEDVEDVPYSYSPESLQFHRITALPRNHLGDHLYVQRASSVPPRVSGTRLQARHRINSMELGSAVAGHAERPPPPAGRPQPIHTNQTSLSRDQTITYASPIIPSRSETRSATHMLKEISYIEGDIKSLDDITRRSLRAFCAKYSTQDLPSAVRLWSGSKTLTYSGNNGRKWVALSTGEQLRTGRFKYGLQQQIIVAQAPRTSEWESGKMVIIVFWGQQTIWRIWRYQQNLDEIPEADCTVECQLFPATPQASPEAGLAASTDSRSLDTAIAIPQPEREAVDSSSITLTHNNGDGLLEIKYKQGDLKRLPTEIERLLRVFCEENPGCKLPCATEDWPPGTDLYRLPTGGSRRWETIDGEEPLRIGYFRYGLKRKILVVQGHSTSSWQNGSARIVVLARGAHHFKIWTGQRVCANIPQEHTLVRWMREEEDSSSEDDEAPSKRTTDHRRQRWEGADRSIEENQPHPPTRVTQSLMPMPIVTGKRRHESSDIQADDSDWARFDDGAKKQKSGHIARKNNLPTNGYVDSLLGEATRSARKSGKPAPTPDPMLHERPTSSLLPIIQSTTAQAHTRPGVFAQVRTPKETSNPEPVFDLLTITIFFFNGLSDEPVYNSTFAEAFDIKSFFVRAKVAGIATNDTLSLKVEVGGIDNWLQRNVQRDYDRLLVAIAKHQVTEISVRFDS